MKRAEQADARASEARESRTRGSHRADASIAASACRVIQAVAAFFAAASLNVAIQTKSSGFTDPDGYYHIRWSAILGAALSHGRLPRFTWLPLTILSPDRYADHHFLFHVFQIPFTWGTDLLVGAKVSAVVFGSLAYLSCYALLVWARVRFGFLWLILLVGSSLLLLARMSLPRAPALMVVLLATTVWLLVAGRDRWLAPLAFVAVWTYSLFPLVGIFTVLWAVAVWIRYRTVAWRPVVATAVGTVAGLVVNPYFPRDIALFLAHLTKALPSGGTVDALGNEWAPLGLGALLTLNAGALLLQAIGLGLALASIRRVGLRRVDAPVIFLGLVSLFLFVLALRSARFVEYWALFAVVFAAFASRESLDDEALAMQSSRRRRVTTLALLSVLGLVAFAYPTLFVAATDVRALPPAHPEAYRGVGEWLAANTPDGALVYNVRWEDFPVLFYFDPHNTFVAGLDPTYLSFAHPDLGREYAAIAAGDVTMPGDAIRDRFGARFAVATVADEAFVARARSDPHMRVAYMTPLVVVFAIDDASAASGPTPVAAAR